MYPALQVTVPGKHFLINLFRHRTLLFQLVRRDFQQRFVGSAAGWLWGLVHPLVLLISWTFVFQICLRTPAPQSLTDNYTMFLFCGFLPWMLFQETVQRSANCLLENSNLITKTVFPAEILPVAVFLSSLASHLMALSLVLLGVIFWLNHWSVQIFLLPVYMVLLGLFAVGVGWIVAGLQVYLRDTAQVVSVGLTLWFWLTPIFIEPERFPAPLQFLAKLNPLAYVVNGYRFRLLSSQWPSPAEFLPLAFAGALVFVLGGLLFRQLKRGFADVL